MAQKTRTELQELFKTGAKPSQQDFTDFIESTLNRMDDGIEKPSGAGVPLKIMTQGDDEKLLDFYREETKTWSISQKSEDEEGLNISNSSGESKLFIDSSSGNVGIGTTTPEAKISVNGGLHVGGTSDPGDNNLLVDGTTTTNGLSVLESLSFSNNIQLKINLHDERYGIGVQANTQYFRTHENFAWYKGGIHDNSELNPGDDGTVQMVIKNGKVGIGTATPGAKLSINGGLHVGGDSNPGDNNLLVDGTTTTSELSVSENLYFATGSRQKINLHEESYGIGIQSATQYFRSLNNFAWYKGGEHNDNELNPGSGTVQMVIKDGNVGIGKAPEDGHKLEIYGGDLVFKVDDPYNNKDQGILFQNAGSYYTWRIYRANAGSDYADLKIDSGKHTSSTDLTNRMTITNDGKVGIGTASPEAKLSINGGLHVGGNSDPGDNNLLVDGTTTTNELSVSGSLSFSDGTRLKINLHDERYGIGIQTDTQYFRTHNNFAWYKGGTHSNNALNPGDDGTVQMVIKNGNVGIGTATPGAKLSVNGGLHVGGNSDPGDNNLEVDGTTTTNELSVSGNLDFATGSRQKINLHQESYGIGIQSETQYFRSLKNFAWYKGGVPDEGRLNPGNGGTVQMVIEDNGNVGIGTDDPGAKLDVDGNLKLQNGVAVNEISDSGTLSSSSQKILTEQAIKSYVDQRLPSGVILMWSGAANQIPQGWVLCDGQNNTPNLKDRFIVGAGNSYNPGNTGGYNQVTLTIEQMPSHNHANGNYKYLMRKNINWTTDGTDKNGANEPDVVNVGEIKSQGSNQAHENRPPYYALCFIMKS